VEQLELQILQSGTADLETGGRTLLPGNMPQKGGTKAAGNEVFLSQRQD